MWPPSISRGFLRTGWRRDTTRASSVTCPPASIPAGKAASSTPSSPTDPPSPAPSASFQARRSSATVSPTSTSPSPETERPADRARSTRLRVEPDRHRPVIHQFHLHLRAEDTGRHLHSMPAHRFGEELVEPLALLRRGG